MRNLRQFFHTTKDVFRIFWKISPGLTLADLVSKSILSLHGIVSTYVFAIILDRIIFIFLNTDISIAQKTKGLLPFIAIYVGIDLIASILSVLNDYFSSLLQEKGSSEINLFHAEFLAKLGISNLENPDLNNKSIRFAEVSGTINSHLSLLIGLLGHILSIITYGVVFFNFVPHLAFLFMILFILKYVSNGYYIKKIWFLYKNTTEERRMAGDSLSYLIGNSLKELVLSRGVSFLRNKFKDFKNLRYSEYKEVTTTWLNFKVINLLLGSLLYGVSVYFILQKGLIEGISIGMLTFYIQSIGSFSDKLDNLSYRLSRVFESGTRLQDALELFEIYKPEADGSRMLPSKKTPPLIEISDLSFKYPNGVHSVVKDLNLKIEPGEKIAIVGKNGAGKTTLVKLLTRIYRPQKGAVLINDINLNEINHKSWYSKLGVLFQDFNTYTHLSIADNIHIGKVHKKFKKKDVVAALIKADALDFVEKYPNKLNQILSERFKGGIRPSGGQWQKIAIARFFYRDAPVLILDEPTASIDAVSEAQIFDNIYKFMKGRTVIIISHRFSTVRNADRILVLDKGKIIEEGSHAELLKMSGKYAHAFKLQAKGYE